MQKRSFLNKLAVLTGLGLAGPVFSSRAAATETHSESAGASAAKRTAVVYFSKSGHTESIARAIAQILGAADLYRIETVESYPAAYKETTEVVKDELDRGVERAIKPLAIELTKYEAIVIGTPTWWHHVAMPVQTWIRSADLSGKRVACFNSHGGGGRMHTQEDFQKLLSNAKLSPEHLTVYSDLTDEAELTAWLKKASVL